MSEFYFSLFMFVLIISCGSSIVVCDGQDVYLNCSVLGTGRLTWIIESTDNILFNLADDSTLITQADSTGQFTASITSFSRNLRFRFLGNITSMLLIRVNSSLSNYPITIYCDDGIKTPIPYTIKLTDLPSPPENVTVEVVYGVSEYTLIVQWNSPRDDGGEVNTNYTVSWRYENDEKSVISVASRIQENISIILKYSTNYFLSITASNCAGTSLSVSLTIVEAGCRAPLVAVGVIIDEYSSTEEGAVIQFHCQNGYHPTEWATSQCINSSWSFDPSRMLCVENIIVSSPTLPEITGCESSEDTNSVGHKNDSLASVVVGVVCSVVFLSVRVLLGVMGLYLIQRVRRKFSGSSFSSPSPLPPPVNYEEVGVVREVKSSQDIQLTTNDAYGPIQNIHSETNSVF